MARGEIHVQLAVNFSKDPKVRALARFGREARGCRDLYVQMLCYCKENLTDGFVPFEEIGVLVYPDTPRAGKRDADRLVEVGLAEVVEGGYQLPGFLKRNKSKAQVDAESAVKAANGRSGGKRSGEVRRAKANAKHSASSNEADAKHSASLCLNTEVIGHRSEDIGQEPPYPPRGTGASSTAGAWPPSAAAAPLRGNARTDKDRNAKPRTMVAGVKLLDEHIKASVVPVPRDMKQRAGEKIDALLEDGFTEDQIRAGLALMRSRPGKGPGLLPEFVHEAATIAASPNVTQLPATGTDGRYMPGSGAFIDPNQTYSDDPKDVFGS